MKKKLLNMSDIIRVARDIGIPLSRPKLYYIVELDPQFPEPIVLPGYKKPRWRKEDIVEWLENVYWQRQKKKKQPAGGFGKKKKEEKK